MVHYGTRVLKGCSVGISLRKLASSLWRWGTITSSVDVGVYSDWGLYYTRTIGPLLRYQRSPLSPSSFLKRSSSKYLHFPRRENHPYMFTLLSLVPQNYRFLLLSLLLGVHQIVRCFTRNTLPLVTKSSTCRSLASLLFRYKTSITT